ncbi:unnamed protein product [Prorocentrum cordatum]|uniref:4a-hydroxytetrahydrobiopterin dehydratase n=1 Tax=Prorocentrum cordatum TaxID=2364126 RepID=A0ABN9PA83_9DINO|nr:unnamed protein product [Polarella glacialis]
MQRLFKLMDCTTMKIGLYGVGDTFREEVLAPFEKLYVCNMVQCGFLCCVIVVSAVAKYILDRPRKYWHCAKSGRWFRFRFAYKAHLRVLEKDSTFLSRLGLMRKLAVWRRPEFTAVHFWSEMSLAFIVMVFFVFNQGLLLLTFSSSDSPKAMMVVAEVLMMLSALLDVVFVYTSPSRRSELVSASLYVGLSMKIAAFVLLLVVAAQEGHSFYGCKDNDPIFTTEGECAIDKMLHRGKLVLESTICSTSLFICIVCGLGFYFARASFISGHDERAVIGLIKKETKFASDEAAHDGELARKDMKACERFARSWKAIPVYLLLAALVALFVVWVSNPSSVEVADSVDDDADGIAKREFSWCYESNCCNGLSSLCSRRYDQVVHATSHNSYSSTADGFNLANHEQSFKDSLEAGVRGLNFDLVTEVTGVTKWCHKFCTLGQMDLAVAFTISQRVLGAETERSDHPHLRTAHISGSNKSRAVSTRAGCAGLKWFGEQVAYAGPRTSMANA